MNEFAFPISKLSKKSVEIAGGKGANLGELFKNKFPVPDGFVVLAAAFNRFLEETEIGAEIDAGIERVNYKDLKSVNEFSSRIRNLTEDADFPGDLQSIITNEFNDLRASFVAVRSSATAEDSDAASWAGELETYLYIQKRELFDAIKRCWASLFTPRAIVYRHEKCLDKKAISVAVVVQTMVDSEISGVCFTAHPVTRNRNHMVIEAGFGLGEAIVSGMITPDTYIIDKKDGTILDITVAQQKKMIIQKTAGGTKEVAVPKKQQGQQALTGKQIIKLSDICKRIEQHYRKPQDVEWAFAGNIFYITQTRPITTL